MLDSNLIPIISSVSMLTLATILHKKKQIKENWTCPPEALVKYQNTGETSHCVDEPGPFPTKDMCEGGPSVGGPQQCERFWSCVNGCSETIDATSPAFQFFDGGRANGPYLPAHSGQQACRMQCSTSPRFGCDGVNAGAAGCSSQPHGDGVNDFTMAPFASEALCQHYQGILQTPDLLPPDNYGISACEADPGPGWNCDRAQHPSGDCVRVQSQSTYPDSAHGGDQQASLNACKQDGCQDSFGCFPESAGADPSTITCRETPNDFINAPGQSASMAECVAANQNCGQDGQYCNETDPANPFCDSCKVGDPSIGENCRTADMAGACNAANCSDRQWWCSGEAGPGSVAGQCVNTHPIPAGRPSFGTEAECVASGCGRTGINCVDLQGNNNFSCTQMQNVPADDPANPTPTLAECQALCGNSCYVCESLQPGIVDPSCTQVVNDPRCEIAGQHFPDQASCVSSGCGQVGAECEAPSGLYPFGRCVQVGHNPTFAPSDLDTVANCPDGIFPGCGACSQSACSRGYTCPVDINACTEEGPADPSKMTLAECQNGLCGTPYACNANACEQVAGGSYPVLGDCQDDNCGLVRYECQDGTGCTELTGNDAAACNLADPQCFETEAECLSSGCNDPYVCQQQNPQVPADPFRVCSNIGIGPGAGVNDQNQPQQKWDAGVQHYADLAACNASGCADRVLCQNEGQADAVCVADPAGVGGGTYPGSTHDGMAACQAAHCGFSRYQCQDGTGCTLLTGADANACDPAADSTCFDDLASCQATGCDNPYVCQANDPANPADPFRICSELGPGPSAGVDQQGNAQTKTADNSYADLAACNASGCADRFSCSGNPGDPGATCENSGPGGGPYANEQQCNLAGCGQRFKCSYAGANPACVVADPADNVLDTYSNMASCQTECENPARPAGEQFACIGGGIGTCVQTTPARAETGQDASGNTIYSSGFDTSALCDAGCKFSCSEDGGDIPGQCNVGNAGADSLADCQNVLGCGTTGAICTQHTCTSAANRAYDGVNPVSGYGGPGDPWKDAVAGDGSGLAACRTTECEDYSWQCNQDDADPLNTHSCVAVDNVVNGVTNPGMYASRELCEADCPNKYGCGNPMQNDANGQPENDMACYKRAGVRASNTPGYFDTSSDCVTNCTNYNCADADQMFCDQSGAPNSLSIYGCQDTCYPKSFMCSNDAQGTCVEQKDVFGDYGNEAQCQADCPQNWYANKDNENCVQMKTPTADELAAKPWLARTVNGYPTQQACINDNSWSCSPGAAGSGGTCVRTVGGPFDFYDQCQNLVGRCGQESAECVDYTCTQRWDVPRQNLGNSDVGECSVGGGSIFLEADCTAAGGTWTTALQVCQNDTSDQRCEKVAVGCIGEDVDSFGIVTGGTCQSRRGIRDATYPYLTSQECADDLCGKYGAGCNALDPVNPDTCTAVTGHEVKFAEFNNNGLGYDTANEAIQACMASGCQAITYDCQVTFVPGGSPTKQCVQRFDANGQYGTHAACEADGCRTDGGSFDCVVPPNVAGKAPFSRQDGRCTLFPDDQFKPYQTRADCLMQGCSVNRTNCTYEPGQGGAEGTFTCEPDFDGMYPQNDGDRCADICNSDTKGYRCEYESGEKDAPRAPGVGVKGPFVVNWDDPGPETYATQELAEYNCKYRCDNIATIGVGGQQGQDMTNVCAGPFPAVLPDGAETHSALYNTLSECNAAVQAAGGCTQYQFKCGGAAEDGDCITAYEDNAPAGASRYPTKNACEVMCGAVCDRIAGTCSIGETGDPGQPDKSWFNTMSSCNNGCANRQNDDGSWTDGDQFNFKCDPATGDCSRTADGTYYVKQVCEDNECNYLCNANDPNAATRCVQASRSDCDQAAQEPGGGRTCYNTKAACDSAVADGSCALVNWCNDHPNYCTPQGNPPRDYGEICVPLADNSGATCECPPGTSRSEFDGDVPNPDSTCVYASQCIDDPENPLQNCIHGSCQNGVCACAEGVEPDSEYGSYGWTRPSDQRNPLSGAPLHCVNQKPCGQDEFREVNGPRATQPINAGRGANPAEGGVGDDRVYRCKICAKKTNADCDYPTDELDQRCSGSGTSDTSRCMKRFAYCGRSQCHVGTGEPGDTDADYDDLPMCSAAGVRTGGEPRDAGNNTYKGVRFSAGGTLNPRYVNNGGQEDVDDDDWNRRQQNGTDRVGYGAYMNYYRFLVANQKLNICRHEGVAMCPGDPWCM